MVEPYSSTQRTPMALVTLIAAVRHSWANSPRGCLRHRGHSHSPSRSLLRNGHPNPGGLPESPSWRHAARAPLEWAEWISASCTGPPPSSTRHSSSTVLPTSTNSGWFVVWDSRTTAPKVYAVWQSGWANAEFLLQLSRYNSPCSRRTMTSSSRLVKTSASAQSRTAPSASGCSRGSTAVRTAPRCHRLHVDGSLGLSSATRSCRGCLS
mmetsp:Transcript_11591/g.23473  ORF Transcript_11591/g.23473 Transcript_11591/m.23473 type:complete len:209 (-) Transcript_11591:214-840(-)